MRLIAIGDIHGQHKMLVDLLGQVAPTIDDQLVFLGDYIDRGPDSPAVLDYLIELRQRFPQTVFLRGNHEQMLLDAVLAAKKKLHGGSSFVDDFLALRRSGMPDAIYCFVSCGGRETLAAYATGSVDSDPSEVLTRIPQAHLDFLNQTTFYHLQSEFMFVHAGVNPKDITGVKQNNQDFLWQRKPLWKADKCWERIVVHGHTPVATPYFDRLEINLDTGAGYGAPLTACDVITNQVWQAEPL